VTFYDLAGNTGIAEYNISRIDKEAPVYSISYAPAETGGMTSGTVVATITGINITVENGDGSYTHTFDRNGEYTFSIRNAVGRRENVTAEVTWLDNDKPRITNVHLSTTEDTNADVTATVTRSEPIHRPDGRNGAATGLYFIKTFTGNATESLTFYDLVGNA
jgi:hypothetical protein